MWFRKWKLWLLILAGIGGSALFLGRVRDQKRADEFIRSLSPDRRELVEADRVAKLGNWEAAGPIFRRLEVKFRNSGDVRNEVYCRVSRYRAEMEVSDLEQLSSALQVVLDSPLAQRDLQLRQRCLETKGNIDLNLDGVAAKPVFQELYEVATRRGDFDAASRASGELGVVAFLEGNAAVAQRNVVLAIGKALINGDRGAQIRYMSLLGQGFTSNKGAERGLWFLNRAVSIARSTRDAGFPKIATTGRSGALIQLGRLSEAQQVIDEGLSYARSRGYLGFQVDLLAQAGELAVAQKNVPLAMKHYEDAAALAAQIHFNRGLAEVQARLAELHEKAGNLDRAVAYAQNSLDARRRTGEVFLLPGQLARLAAVQSVAGKVKESENTYRTAERVVDTMLHNTPSPGVRKSVLAAMSDVYVGHFELAIRKGDLAEAYSVIEEARGRVAADRLRVTDGQRMVRAEATRAERALALAQTQLLDSDDPRDRRVLSDALLPLEAEMMDSGPEAMPETPFVKADVSDLQRVLGPDELVLQFVLAESRSYCLLIGANRLQSIQLQGRSQIEQEVERFLTTIKKEKDGREEGRALFTRLLGQIPGGLPRHLILIPDGLLHRLPFAALTDGNLRYVVESTATSYVPSGAVLALLRKKPPLTRGSVLAVGDIPYGQATAIASMGRPWNPFRALLDLSRRTMSPLPATGQEMRTFLSILGQQNGASLSGEAATEANFRRAVELPQWLLLIAGHAFVDRAFPDRSGIVLARDPKSTDDGILQMREIRRLPLSSTNLAIISACDTSDGRIDGQEGVSSIVSAFLYAGVRSAVAHFWLAEDNATAEVMKVFYENLAAGQPKVEALRRAQDSLLRKPGYLHMPLYWAGFNLSGDGSDAIERIQ